MATNQASATQDAFDEVGICFTCERDKLFGIIHAALSVKEHAVVFVVGGPQYRAGSHQQFTLLARQFAENDIPSLRFDYRGMGDSEGESRDFLSIQDDIRAAIDAFFYHIPSLKKVSLWGLCDGASAAILYAPSDARVNGVIAVNPWVHTDVGQAKAILKYYYWKRITSSEFWRKIIRFEFSFALAWNSFTHQIRTALSQGATQTKADGQSAINSNELPAYVFDALTRFAGEVMFITCTEDLTAQEFLQLTQSSIAWKKLLSAKRFTSKTLQGANHTFSRKAWRDQLALWSTEWLRNR
mgnify:CR=1 FL=1